MAAHRDPSWNRDPAPIAYAEQRAQGAWPNATIEADANVVNGRVEIWVDLDVDALANFRLTPEAAMVLAEQIVESVERLKQTSLPS